MSEDPRIAAGMARQLARRDEAVAGGAAHRGWKVAFPTPAAQQNAGVAQPLLAFLTDATILESGATVDLTGWAKPTAEAELALHVGPGGSVAAVGAAIEVVDLDRRPTEVEDVTAAGLFHRHYVLGPARAGADVADVTMTGVLDGAVYATEPNPTDVIGTPAAVARFAAAELERHGARLADGDVVLAGSALPLQPVAAGQALTVDAGPLGTLTLHFATF
jgi:2-keto-4-pentenoate hydratase